MITTPLQAPTPSLPETEPLFQKPLHPLKRARIERNITQQMLADFTGLSTPTIKRAEAGKAISITVHYRLCQYFGKSSRELGLRYQVRG